MTSPSSHGPITLIPQRPTVAKHLVRKTDASEVLITTWHGISDNKHVATIQWPPHHPFYTTQQEAHSPLLFTESTRQALALLSHTEFGIPLEHRLGWDHATCSTTPHGLRTTRTPAEIQLHITHTSIERRRRGCARLEAEIHATRDGTPVGTARIKYTAYPEAIYRRLRGHHASAEEASARALPPGPPMPPTQVGRERPHDVVLTPTPHPNLWLLRTDLTHPTLFDHPHDHIPGMVLLEAFSQAAHSLRTPQPIHPHASTSFHATFNHYTELDQPCLIKAHTPTPTTIQLTATQASTTTATAHINIPPSPINN